MSPDPRSCTRERFPPPGQAGEPKGLAGYALPARDFSHAVVDDDQVERAGFWASVTSEPRFIASIRRH